MDVRDVTVVVSRWFGGILLGPDRFKHINNAARLALEANGFVRAAAKKPHSKR
jgi:putative IMPACT (imprinted ancient) family translation regulator